MKLKIFDRFLAATKENNSEAIPAVEEKKKEIQSILDDNQDALSFDDLKSIRSKLNRIDLLYKNRGHLENQSIGVTALQIDRVLADEESYDPQKAAQLVPNLFVKHYPLT